MYNVHVYVQVDDSPFEVLKDLHGTTVNHQYTVQERNILQSYNSEVCTMNIVQCTCKGNNYMSL